MSETIHVRTRDAADVLGITERTVRKHLAAGKLQGQRVNGAWLVELDRAQVEDAGIELEPIDPDAPDDGPRTVIVQRPEERQSVDLAPLADLVETLTRENASLAASSAMWQERARALEERMAALAPGPSPDPPPRSWWRRLLDRE